MEIGEGKKEEGVEEKDAVQKMDVERVDRTANGVGDIRKGERRIMIRPMQYEIQLQKISCNIIVWCKCFV